MSEIAISASAVAELRAKTSAGLMDCKKALAESKGNIEEAITWLRKKGVASAAKKAGREASEGLVEAYIHHGGRVGVLIEVNCESDFVAKTDAFKALVRDIAMHIVAANPQFINRDEVSEEFLAKEREIAAASVAGKPAEVVEKIVSGKMEKIYSQVCLMEQPFIKNPDLSVKDIVTEAIAKMGENIIVRRFSRFGIGE